MSVNIEQTDIADLLVQQLKAQPMVTTICGERITPDEFEQGEPLPAIRYETLQHDEEMHLGGMSESAVSRVQFDAAAATRREANRLAMYVHATIVALSGRTLEVGDFRIRIWAVVPDSNYSRKDPGPPGGAQPRYRRVLDFVITHESPLAELVPAVGELED